jgi:hypothetical protein
VPQPCLLCLRAACDDRACRIRTRSCCSKSQARSATRPRRTYESGAPCEGSLACNLDTHDCTRSLRKWVGSLEVMRSRLQPVVPPLPPPPARLRATDGGPEQAAVDAWVGAASAVAAAETAAAKLESAIDSCQTAGLCDDMNVLAAAAKDAAEQGASQEQQPFNPS